MKVRNYTRAETLLTQTVDTMRSLAGEANPIVAKAIGQHGRLYAKQKDFVKAESYYVKALRIQREHLDPNHADLAWTLTYLARARTQLKKHDEAEPLFKEMYETAQVVRGKENKTVAIRLYDWARCLAAQYKYEDAEPKLREALRLFEIVFKPGSLSIDRGRIQLAACLTHLEKFAEAEPLLQTAYGSVTTADEPDSTTLEDAINALIELYEKWNRPADAAEWKDKTPRCQSRRTNRGIPLERFFQRKWDIEIRSNFSRETRNPQTPLKHFPAMRYDNSWCPAATHRTQIIEISPTKSSDFFVICVEGRAAETASDSDCV